MSIDRGPIVRFWLIFVAFQCSRLALIRQGHPQEMWQEFACFLVAVVILTIHYRKDTWLEPIYRATSAGLTFCGLSWVIAAFALSSFMDAHQMEGLAFALVIIGFPELGFGGMLYLAWLICRKFHRLSP